MVEGLIKRGMRAGGPKKITKRGKKTATEEKRGKFASDLGRNYSETPKRPRGETLRFPERKKTWLTRKKFTPLRTVRSRLTDAIKSSNKGEKGEKKEAGGKNRREVRKLPTERSDLKSRDCLENPYS